MQLFNKMATSGGTVGVSSFPSTPSCFCKKSRVHNSIISLTVRKSITTTIHRQSVTTPRIVACSAVQESSASTVAADAKEVKKVEKKVAPAKAKPAKAPVKPLPQMMEEDILPSLRATLEAQDDISELELSFQENRLQGSFLKKGIPHSFWAFFPSGSLSGPKGFSLSSYGSEASTVEPFLVDEKKITDKHVVFWVEKRLAAQGIIPVWKE